MTDHERHRAILTAKIAIRDRQIKELEDFFSQWEKLCKEVIEERDTLKALIEHAHAEGNDACWFVLERHLERQEEIKKA